MMITVIDVRTCSVIYVRALYMPVMCSNTVCTYVCPLSSLHYQVRWLFIHGLAACWLYPTYV